MTDKTWLSRWDERYSNKGFAYGTEPNNYLKNQLKKLNPGTILFPAEGEGRNAVLLLNSDGKCLHLISALKGKTKHYSWQKATM
ncbi:hypothetical protein PMI13_00489 [Chryseobacterium populi]|uniref:Uncharacterized protein n=1 Tax=Chryseobacterium populi TaxID=1144316 RepID=J2K5L1_9FLAO|nr:hypothetical protein PMI13_00489 [Chryseobacterium populi]